MTKPYTFAIVAVLAVLAVFLVAAAKARTPQELALWLWVGMTALLAVVALGLWLANRRLT